MAYTLPGEKTKAFLEHCKTHFKHGLTYDLDAKRANSRGFRPPAQIMLDRAKGDFTVSYTHLTLPTICSV